MEYTINNYKVNNDDTARFVLGIKGNNPLIVIGLNPSTANEKKPDRTISKIMGFAEGANFDSIIMLNLYPQRATKPNDLHTTVDCDLFIENIEVIITIINSIESASILCAWGNNIGIRPYLKEAISDIYTKTKSEKINWFKVGELTTYKNPRHPLYVKYEEGLSFFKIDEYTFIK